MAQTPFARERLTVTNAVKQLTSSVYNPVATGDTSNRIPYAQPARRAEVFVRAEPINFTKNGTDPDAVTTVGGVGAPAAADDVILLNSFEEIVKFKAIRSGGTDALIEVIYYR